MLHGDNWSELDDATVTAVRSAARALADQDGRGIPRKLILSLTERAAHRVTVLPGDPTVAVVHPPRPGAARIFADLTAREREVAQLVAAGHSNREIATELVVSLATVKDHVHRILRKTQLPSRAAVSAAWRA